tara:strand:+ start:192 stop:440 length:249 start_codon:yes stop_codon:yes gene_type:complete
VKYLAVKIIDELIDERIKAIQDKKSQTKQKKDTRHKDGSSFRMSALQRYIKASNKRDNQSILEATKKRRFLLLSQSNRVFKC